MPIKMKPDFAFSPDSKFCAITGGQDDLVTAYSLIEQRVIARCQGHASFVTALSFDPWFSDDRSCRFASVSEDCKLIFVSESCLLITIIQKKKKPISNLLCLKLFFLSAYRIFKLQQVNNLVDLRV
ncbi:hypothetical protein VP01_988g1 [Puccinia sorghi]|uniref:Uncharacterized protein n=1 Tax=Puccinia sorghi TaxID=27349 RepID=A0A0L6U5H5_9BASI|nr:hypothetical protein VP01_988g1 [Puccinia sorghi]